MQKCIPDIPPSSFVLRKRPVSFRAPPELWVPGPKFFPTLRGTARWPRILITPHSSPYSANGPWLREQAPSPRNENKRNGAKFPNRYHQGQKLPPNNTRSRRRRAHRTSSSQALKRRRRRPAVALRPPRPLSAGLHLFRPRRSLLPCSLLSFAASPRNAKQPPDGRS